MFAASFQAFVHDPLINWRLLKPANEPRQPDGGAPGADANATAAAAGANGAAGAAAAGVADGMRFVFVFGFDVTIIKQMIAVCQRVITIWTQLTYFLRMMLLWKCA